MVKISFAFLLVLFFYSQSFSSDMQKLRISSNNRFLIKEDGSPFVWIGATMWKWRKLSIKQIKMIFDDHASKGYNVIQLIAYPDEYETVDEIIDYAATRDIYIGIVVCWYRDVLRGNEAELYNSIIVDTNWVTDIETGTTLSGLRQERPGDIIEKGQYLMKS